LTLSVAAGRMLLRPQNARGAFDSAAAELDPPAKWPTLTRAPLGATGFEASPLVFGCGAALSRRRRDQLLDAAFAAGINVFDVGHRAYYGNAEKHLAPFLARHRDEVFLISKGLAGHELGPADAITPALAKAAATMWSKFLDESLKELAVEQVDAYYFMAQNNAALVESDEMQGAAATAKKAGKFRFLGLSTHQNQENVLEAAMRTGNFGLAMIAVTPAGWYNWIDKGISPDSPPMNELQPFLAKVRASGIGLVGMKAGRYLSGGFPLGWSTPSAFDAYYSKDYLQNDLSGFQRSYAFVLAHGLNVVNADMQSMAHLRENVIAAAESAKFFSADSAKA
ncbi:MAG: aldo/keto reductase, partial [Deltaproteobacteria bacterium]